MGAGAGPNGRHGEPERPAPAHCHYCGRPVPWGIACSYHADLPRLEAELRGDRSELTEAGLIRAWRPGAVQVPRSPRRP